MKIYVTGPVGTSGALNLYQEHKALFEQRFAPFFLERVNQLAGQKDRKLTLAKCEDCIYICTIADGGIFGALWEGCEKLQCGCEIILENIPIRQEVIEITELLHENPYELPAEDCFVLFIEENHKKDLFGSAEGSFPKTSGELVQIGRTTKNKDRVILQAENRRYLTPPSRQQKDIQDRKHTKANIV